jgi:hypothetical protein
MLLLSRLASITLIHQHASLLLDANGTANIHLLELLLNNVAHHQLLLELLQLLLLQLL